MTVPQLECFLAVARTRNFRIAAEQLGKTQPALSVQIQRLEASVGTTLLERAGKHVQLTSSGQILVPHAERILAEVRDSEKRLLEVKNGDLGIVRIGVLPSIAAHFLPPVIQAFKARLPGLSVTLREEPRTPLLVPLLRNNEIEVIVGLRPARSDKLKSHALFTEDFCLAVSRDHPLAQRPSVPLAALQNEKFIFYKNPRHGTRELTLQYCRAAGFEPHIEFESEQAETIQNLVAVNLGIALLPQMILRDRKDLAQVSISGPAPSRTIAASWKPGRYLSIAVREFLRSLEDVSRNWQDSSATAAARAASAGK